MGKPSSSPSPSPSPPPSFSFPEIDSLSPQEIEGLLSDQGELEAFFLSLSEVHTLTSQLDEMRRVNGDIARENVKTLEKIRAKQVLSLSFSLSPL